MSVYLDWAATAVPDPQAIRLFSETSLTHFANPASPHAPGKRASDALEEARRRCADALNVPSRGIFFTSGGTESDHLPLLSLLQRPVRGSIAISALEHPAVAEQARAMERLGFEILRIPPNAEGFVTPEAVSATVRSDTLLVAVMAVHNESGAIQPVGDIADSLTTRCAGARRPHFHVDAVQAVGKVRFRFDTPGIDSFAVSAHKIGGPRGIGLLYAAKPFEPFLRGGGQENGIRSGTVNVAGATALAHCLERCLSSNDEIDRVGDIGTALVRALSSIPEIGILPRGRSADCQGYSPAIVQCTNESLPGEVLVRVLSERGFHISTGSACSSKKGRQTGLEAMKVAADAARNAVRVSIGPSTTPEEITAFAAALSSAARGDTE